MWLIERQFCNSLKISGGIMWNDVEEIGTPGEETKMLAISVDFTPIPRERTVRPGKSPSYKYNKKKSEYLCFWRFFLYSPGVLTDYYSTNAFTYSFLFCRFPGGWVINCNIFRRYYYRLLFPPGLLTFVIFPRGLFTFVTYQFFRGGAKDKSL